MPLPATTTTTAAVDAANARLVSTSILVPVRLDALVWAVVPAAALVLRFKHSPPASTSARCCGDVRRCVLRTVIPLPTTGCTVLYFAVC